MFNAVFANQLKLLFWRMLLENKACRTWFCLL